VREELQAQNNIHKGIVDIAYKIKGLKGGNPLAVLKDELNKLNATWPKQGCQVKWGRRAGGKESRVDRNSGRMQGNGEGKETERRRKGDGKERERRRMGVKLTFVF
jgi:hypothetical protein